MDEYCIEELTLHYEALVRREARQTGHWATALRLAQNGDRKAFKGFLEHLDDMWRQIELAAGRNIVNADKFFGQLAGIGQKRK